MPIDAVDVREALRNVPLFRHVSEACFEEILSQAEIITYHPGETVYRQGGAADSFYVIAQGRLRLAKKRQNKLVSGRVLAHGDNFGEETLSSRRWDETCSVLDETSLIRISGVKLARIMARRPEVKAAFHQTLETRHLSHQAGLDFLQDDEVVYFIARKHPVFLFGRLLVPALLGLASVVAFAILYLGPDERPLALYLVDGAALWIAALWALWNIIDWYNDYSLVTNQRLVWLERIAGFYDSRQEAPISTVLSVDVRTSQLGRIVGYGDVLIRTYSGMVRFQGVRSPRHVAALVEDHWFRAKESSKREEAVAIDQAIRQRLGLDGAAPPATGTRTGDNVPARRLVKPGSVPAVLSTFLHMRFEQGRTITYRKHWFILIQQTAKPLFWLALGIAVLLARAFDIFTLFSLEAIAVVGGLYIIGIACWLLYQYLDWRNDIFQVTLEQVVDIDKKPFGKEEKKSAPLENILSIQYRKLGLLGVIFNFGTVFITVGNTELTFDTVFNPSQVQEDIYNRMAERAAWKKKVELEEQRERISEWFASYTEIQRETQDDPDETEWEEYPDSDVF